MLSDRAPTSSTPWCGEVVLWPNHLAGSLRRPYWQRTVTHGSVFVTSFERSDEGALNQRVSVLRGRRRREQRPKRQR